MRPRQTRASIRRGTLAALALAAALSALPGAQREAAAKSLFAPGDPLYRDECGSCHIAYPAPLLGADGWRAIVDGLDRHFGVDASVDPARRARIATYLNDAAGTGAALAGARISETPWFAKEHRKVPAATWRSDAVKTAANCGACHTAADGGDFGKRSRRVPR